MHLVSKANERVRREVVIMEKDDLMIRTKDEPQQNSTVYHR